MKNEPSIDSVLRWAKHLKLCGPALENLERFLLTEVDGQTNLDRIFEESKVNGGLSFSELVGLEFRAHVVETAFQVAV